MGKQAVRNDAPFRKRFRRRLYYADGANTEIPSLPLTEMAVDYFHDSCPYKLNHIDVDLASNLVRRNRVTPCSVVMSLLYAKRLRQSNSDYLHSMSSSDVFFISMMMASKYMYDEGVDEEVYNDEWADNESLDTGDVNKMEVDFLQAIDWRLFVRMEEFENTLLNVERSLALREALHRNSFTYSELSILLDSNFMTNVWTQLSIDCAKLASVVTTAYIAGVVSVLASTALAAQIAGHLTTATMSILSLHSSISFTTALTSIGLTSSLIPMDWTSLRYQLGHHVINTIPTASLNFEKLPPNPSNESNSKYLNFAVRDPENPLLRPRSIPGIHTDLSKRSNTLKPNPKQIDSEYSRKSKFESTTKKRVRMRKNLELKNLESDSKTYLKNPQEKATNSVSDLYLFVSRIFSAFHIRLSDATHDPLSKQSKQNLTTKKEEETRNPLISNDISKSEFEHSKIVDFELSNSTNQLILDRLKSEGPPQRNNSPSHSNNREIQRSEKNNSDSNGQKSRDLNPIHTNPTSMWSGWLSSIFHQLVDRGKPYIDWFPSRQSQGFVSIVGYFGSTI